jgi:hypothetical protein
MEETPDFLAGVDRQCAVQERPSELRVRQRSSGITSEQIGQHRVTAGSADDAVDTLRIAEQQFLELDALRQLVAELALPGSLVAA